MPLSRREFIANSAATVAGITVLPFAAHAAGHSGQVFETPGGKITVHPVNHASFVMETPKGTIYVDTVGDAAGYSNFPKPDFVLITHHHGDHYKPETLAGLMTESTKMLVNPEVMKQLPDDMKSRASEIGNGGTSDFNGVGIEAIPAYNLTEDRKKFHPKGRDNGYVLNFDGFRIYISGDTEDIPEMRALKDIDLAFVCMNLPFTMEAKAAASAVAEFKPKVVYPYHYRGRPGGTQDPKEFAKLVGDASEVRLAPWYGA